MEQYFDIKNDRLVCINKKAGSKFWDSHWDKYDVAGMIKASSFNRLVVVPTKKYLPEGSRILEGGCGLGRNVWSLYKNGYNAYGIDYAGQAVEKVKAAVPDLKVSFGDLRNLEFKDHFFDGYWSLGVIEHFYQGYDEIANEMKRVIKPGGYLFLTFPCMSVLRKKRAKKGMYKRWEESKMLMSGFYQFCLSVDSVKSHFKHKGFKLLESNPIGGLKGFKDEIEFKLLKNQLQRLFDSHHIAGRALAWGIDKMLAPFAGHSQFMVFKSME
jgi:SAM-dependent methyltransferase